VVVEVEAMEVVEIMIEAMVDVRNDPTVAMVETATTMPRVELIDIPGTPIDTAVVEMTVVEVVADTQIVMSEVVIVALRAKLLHQLPLMVTQLLVERAGNLMEVEASRMRESRAENIDC